MNSSSLLVYVSRTGKLAINPILHRIGISRICWNRQPMPTSHMSSTLTVPSISDCPPFSGCVLILYFVPTIHFDVQGAGTVKLHGALWSIPSDNFAISKPRLTLNTLTCYNFAISRPRLTSNTFALSFSQNELESPWAKTRIHVRTKKKLSGRKQKTVQTKKFFGRGKIVRAKKTCLDGNKILFRRKKLLGRRSSSFSDLPQDHFGWSSRWVCSMSA